MTEEQQGSTLGVFLKEVFAWWSFKETDWRTATEGTTLGDRLRESEVVRHIESLTTASLSGGGCPGCPGASTFGTASP